MLLAVVLVSLSAGSLAGPARLAEAHANLVRSEPAANSVLADSPPAVQLWFSETPEPRFSEIAVYTSASVPVKTGALQVAPEDHNALFIKLDPLPPGTYTVAWKALSAVDGHTTAGAFAFAVGVGQSVSGPVTGVLSQVGESTRATPGSVAVRWLTYLATSILIGALAFVPLVSDPALRALRRSLPGIPGSSPGDSPGSSSGRANHLAGKDAPEGVLWVDDVRLALTRRALQIVSFGFWATVVMSLVAAVAQAAAAANVSIIGALSLGPGSPLLTLLLSTRYGQVWIGRLLLLSLLAFAFMRLRATRRLPSPRAAAPWYVAAAIATLIPLTTSLNSHEAAVAPGFTPAAPWLPIFSDWVHLVSTGFWVGGLVLLAVALPAGLAAAGAGHRLALLARVIPAFSRVAAACVAALLLTGLYQSLLQVGSWGALFGTTFGRALAAKIGLVIPLLLLGLFNLVFSGPRLGRAATAARGSADSSLFAHHSSLSRAFAWAVRGEALLACSILVAAGVMTSSPPARDAWAEANRGVILEKTAEDLRLRLHVDPAEPGFNAFTLTVRDARSGKPVADAEKVALILTMVEMDMGENELVLQSRGDGTYYAESGLASMLGTWNGEALVRRRGRDDVRAPFSFHIGQQPTANPAAQGTAQPGGFGAGAAVTPVAPADARFLKNPIEPTQESLARGQQVFTQNCMVCHGVNGRGDGPAAQAMRPPPADLTQHVQAHTEGELWWFISNGVTGTQMPAWKNALSDNERWDVVNYIVSAFSPASK